MKSKPKTEYWNSSKLEVLHLFSPAAFWKMRGCTRIKTIKMPIQRKWLFPNRKKAWSMCCFRPEYRKTLRDLEQERSPRLPGVSPGGRRHHGSETQNSKATGLARPVMPCSRPIKWTRCLQGPGTKYCVIARPAGWWPEGLIVRTKGSHQLVQPHHRGWNHGTVWMDGHLQLHQNDGANNWPTGKPGASCPLDSHDDLAHDPRFHWRSIPRTCHESDHQVCGPISILIGLEGVGMDDSWRHWDGWRGANVWKFCVEELEESGIGIGTEWLVYPEAGSVSQARAQSHGHIRLVLRSHAKMARGS